MKPSNPHASDYVFETAKRIAADLKDMVEDCEHDVVHYANILVNMRQDLVAVKVNLERHAVPLHKRKSKERKAVRRKIRAIDEAISVISKLENTLNLTFEDVGQIMRPFAPIARDGKFLEKIMEEGPTDGELRDIEGAE